MWPHTSLNLDNNQVTFPFIEWCPLYKLTSVRVIRYYCLLVVYKRRVQEQQTQFEEGRKVPVLVVGRVGAVKIDLPQTLETLHHVSLMNKHRSSEANIHY